MKRFACSLLVPAAALGIAVVSGWFIGPVFAQAPAPRMVNAEDRVVRVMTGGFEHLDQGQPVVVFESGSGTSIGNWGGVLGEVATFAPVVAYERGGIGQSEWDGRSPTPERVTGRLHALLGELGARPPYVLVGAEWGGYLIRHFAGRYPDTVVGLVYVDPIDFTKRRSEELATFAEIGVADGEAAQEAMNRAFPFPSQAPPPIQAQNAVVDSLMTLEPEARGLLSFPPVPVAVLLGTRYQEPPPPPPGSELGFAYRDYFEATVRQRVRKTSAWALEAPEGLFVVATHAGHYVHQDDPALLVDAIRRIVFPDISRQLRDAIGQGGVGAMEEIYHILKRRYPTERFEANLLRALGYEMLGSGDLESATALFRLNVEEYPDSPDPYDSLGDAYRAADRLEDARRSYARAVDLAEQQGDNRLPTYRRSLERVSRQLERQ